MYIGKVYSSRLNGKVNRLGRKELGTSEAQTWSECSSRIEKSVIILYYHGIVFYMSDEIK